MGLENTMICFDNSEWMRNGDFVPTRLQVQMDATNLLLQCKLRSHPESCVGVLSMADGVKVLSTMTNDHGKLFMKIHQLQPTGKSNFLAAIRVAHLALKNRQNRQARTRIVVFVGSPIELISREESHDGHVQWVKLAKKLKKEKVSADIVCFGEIDSPNTEVMNAFVDTLNGREGTLSNLVIVPAGSNLTEALLSSPVCRGEDGTAPVAALSAGAGGEFDPTDDPELAMALRVSLEEQRQRQEQEGRERATAATGGGQNVDVVVPPTAVETSGSSSGQPAPSAEPDFSSMTEEEQLNWALQMSLQQDIPAAAEEQGPSGAKTEPMEVDGGEEQAAASGEKGDEELVMDADALKEMMDSLPADIGVGTQAVKQAFKTQGDDKDKSDKEAKKKKEDKSEEEKEDEADQSKE